MRKIGSRIPRTVFRQISALDQVMNRSGGEHEAQCTLQHTACHCHDVDTARIASAPKRTAKDIRRKIVRKSRVQIINAAARCCCIPIDVKPTNLEIVVPTSAVHKALKHLS